MSLAQQRAHRIRAFRAELETLLADGVLSLTDAQKQAIEAHHGALLRQLAAEHDIDRTETAGQLSRGMRVASFFAAVALTAAIYSLVSRFWGRLDLPMQATLLCAFPLMALVGVELSARRERTLYISSIFALAAFGTYWLAVGELSRLLNVPLTPPVLWGGAIFGIALAVPFGFRLILGSALVALLAALAGTAFQAAGLPWIALVEFPEIITFAALLLALMSTRLWPRNPPFAAVTRIAGLSVGFIGLLMLSLSGRVSLLPTPNNISVVIYQVVMLLVTVLALVVAVRRQWSETLYLSAAALTLFLFSRFVDWWARRSESDPLAARKLIHLEA